MALFARSGPIGVDIPISGLQKFLYAGLGPIWGTTSNNLYDSYDRCYRELVDPGYVPKMPKPNSQGVLEYAALSLDTETTWATSFCHLGDEVKHDWRSGTSTARISWFFWVNLKKIKPGITDHRADEEARNDVLKLLYKYSGYEIEGWTIGYENVFRDFKGMLTQDKKEYLDLHPQHVFRIDTAVAFKLTDCTPTNQFSFNNKI